MDGLALLTVGMTAGDRGRQLRDWSARTGAFHYEADDAASVADAMRRIERVRPRLLAVDGGDGAVGAVIAAQAPDAAPVLLLPHRRRGAIARDVGSGGCALRLLSAAAALGSDGLEARVRAVRPLLVESDGRSAIGMTLSRRAGVETVVRVGGVDRAIRGRFGLFVVTALARLGAGGRLKLMAVDGRLPRLAHAVAAWAGGRVAYHDRAGLRVALGDDLLLETAGPGLTLDGVPLALDAAAPVRMSLGEPVRFLRV